MRRLHSSSFQSHRGIGTNLVITLGILVLLFTLGMAFFTFLRGEQHLSKRFYEREQMIYVAEAAVEETALHIRRTMNMDGQQWYDHLREPTASMTGVPAIESFSPVFTHKICQETFPGGYDLDVSITMDKVESFIDDPAPDAVEKT
ncbi:MAG: hypothetical protein QGH40_09100, partial [bacterium]|nr:hypothetical protein [bacterium]